MSRPYDKGPAEKALQKHMTRSIRKATSGDLQLARFVSEASNVKTFSGWTLSILIGAAIYADEHLKRYGSNLGEDQVLGEAFRELLTGVHGLLNGETGGADCGTISHMIDAVLEAAGLPEK